MLKKNKDYVEFTLQYTSVDWARSKDCPEVCLKGYSDFSFPGVPIMDVVCNEFDHKVVVVSKRDFEALQTENEQLKKKLNEFDPMPEFRELLKKLFSTEDVEKLEWTLNHICGGRASANGWIAVSSFWKQDYEKLSKLIGFSSVEEIQDYLTNEAECDTIHEAISKLHDQVKYTCDEWYSANSRNNSWKAAAECNSPKELIEKREALEGKVKVLETEAEVYSRALKEWKEGTGCPSPSAAKTLIESGMSYVHGYHEAQEENRKLTEEIDSWKNVTGYSTPESYLAARLNNTTPFDYTAAWQAVTGCSCPRDLSKKIVEWEKILTPHMSARDLCSAMSNVIDFDKSKIVKWRTATGCDAPDQVKTRIEGLENAVRLTDRTMIKELENNIDEWQKATGCDTPDKAKERIKALNERIDESEADYNHLLCTTGFESEGEIEDALDKCDHSTLRKALVDYEFDYEALLKFTGYKSEHDIRVMLNGEKYQYKTMRELINSLERKVKFTESNWQGVTGFSTPEKCSSYIDRLEKKLEDIKNLTEED